MVHSKYVNFISPKHARDFKFQETIEKLTTLFGLQTSQFNVCYNCLQITKDPASDFIIYAGMVNRQCEWVKLNDLALDQFKCLIFVMGLKSTTEYDIRTKLLNKLESESDKITLDLLSAEC